MTREEKMFAKEKDESEYLHCEICGDRIHKGRYCGSCKDDMKELEREDKFRHG
jgi:hypothetical protein